MRDNKKYYRQNELSFDSAAILPFQLARQAKETPDCTALTAPLAEANQQQIFQITYKELKRRISSWAEVLKEHGVGPEAKALSIQDIAASYIRKIDAIQSPHPAKNLWKDACDGQFIEKMAPHVLHTAL